MSGETHNEDYIKHLHNLHGAAREYDLGEEGNEKRAKLDAHYESVMNPR